ncbi:unnamed protein product [Sphagnum balticum]
MYGGQCANSFCSHCDLFSSYQTATGEQRQQTLAQFITSGDSVGAVTRKLYNAIGAFRLAIELRIDISNLMKSTAITLDSNGIRKCKVIEKTLSNWLSVALSQDHLQLQNVNYNSSSAELVDTVTAGDIVHSSHTFEQRRARFGANKRVYAFTHPSAPNWALAFVHVALTSSMATRTRSLSTLLSLQQVTSVSAAIWTPTSVLGHLRGLCSTPLTRCGRASVSAQSISGSS